MEMKVVDLSAWPFAARVVLELAEQHSDAASHAQTTGAHVASVLLQMQPVRRLLSPDEVVTLDRAVELALMLQPKSRGVKAQVCASITRVLLGDQRTTAQVVRTATVGKSDELLLARADEIAALLDAQQLAEILKPSPEQRSPRCAFFSLGHVLASQRGHRELTTRHVLAAALRAFHNVLSKNGQPGIEEACAQLDALLEATPNRQGNLVGYTPRVVGAIAGAVAKGDTSSGLLSECLEGDGAVQFAGAALRDAMARIATLQRATANQ